MKLLLYIAKQRIKVLLNPELAGWSKVLVNVFIITVGCLNGLGLGSLMNLNLAELDIPKLKVIILTSTPIILAILEFVPSYTPKTNVIARYFPVPTPVSQLANLTIEILKVKNLAFAAMIVTLFLVASSFSVIDLLLGILLLTTGVIITRTLKGIIEERTALIRRSTVLALVAIGIIIAFTVFPTVQQRVIVVFAMFVIALYNEISINPKANQKISYQESEAGSIYSYTGRIKKTRMALLIGLAAKIAVFIFLQFTKNDSVPILKYLAITPITVFTYLFNNAWGFFHELWYQTHIRVHSAKKHISLYLKLLAVPVLVDAVITVIGVFATVTPSWVYLIFYLSSFVCFICIGLISSQFFPINVRNGINPFSMQPAASYIAALLDTAIIFLLWSFLSRLYLFPVIVLISIVITKQLLQSSKFAASHHRLFRQI